MIDYQAVKAVVSVIRLGSFDRAARELKVTQSAVSQRVKQLEQRLGVALIVRGSPCSATTAGAQLVHHFERVELLERQLASRMPGLIGPGSLPERMTIRIAANPEWLGSWILDAVSNFVRSAPFLFDLILDETIPTLERLRACDVVAAVTLGDERLEDHDNSWLGSLRLVAVATPDYSRRHFPQGAIPEAMAKAPGLALGPADTFPKRWVKVALGDDVEFPVHRLPSGSSIFDAVLAGLGWGIVPLHLAAAHLRSGTLTELTKGTGFDLPVQWQVHRVAVHQLEGLTATIVRLAQQSLKLDGIS
ncbi:ArgP/LysG family DNA-binding transcriptional regulator [Agrobacterium pusense]|uniref:Chromosome replication initiation inhibitor protein n=1 Tax=Agrobacterium pusense TaxID=648995 RepID=U4QEF7_9HYPH|nr:ArgP/LysG family DNA-binding transcriptional regulator [Agrobacterium pusense]CDI11978.1 Chromosome replication initiation inhibitor protein [Agrobacterium pusense]